MPSAFFNHARRLIILLVMAALFAACNNAPAPVVVNEPKTPTGNTPPRTSLPMPPTTTTSSSNATSAQNFTLLDDRQAKLSDYLGKVVVLDFWATYCPPCRDEAPHLDALQQRYASQGLIVIGLNVGGSDDRPLIADFAKGLSLKYMLGYPDPEMTDLYLGNDDRIPQTIIFDRQGRIVEHLVGYDQDGATELERAIQEALKEKG